MARRFEIASERQKPYLRLIEEIRLTPAGTQFEAAANEAMLRALMNWVAGKAAAAGLAEDRLAALTLAVFGGWLFYLDKRQQGIELELIDHDVMRRDWAARWAEVLDRPAAD